MMRRRKPSYAASDVAQPRSARATPWTLPSITPGKVLLARFQPKRFTPNSANASKASPASESAAYDATGFVGLIDQPVFGKAPQFVKQEFKKKWWQRHSA